MKLPDPLTKIHCLAFMYLAFAKLSDGELTDDERSTMHTKLQEWCDAMSETRNADDFINESIDWFNSCEDQQERLNTMDGMARLLADSGMEEKHRGAVVADLVSSAKADGDFGDVEKKWIELLTKSMEDAAS